jgi:hypothetical protein
MVSTDFIRKGPKALQRPMRPLAFPARVRVGDECSVEKGIQNTIESVMDQSIPYRRLVNVSWLGIGYFEGLVTSVTIGLILQAPMQGYNMVGKSVLKLLDIPFVSLAFQKLPPGRKQVFNGDGIMVGMDQLSTHTTKITPPPPTFPQPKLIPVVLKLKESYGLWQNYLASFPKANRFTLGSKIDDVFLAAIEYCFLASYANIAEKQILLDRAISRTDLIKLLLQLAWDIRAIDHKKYASLGERLAEVGRMLGGWKRQLQQKTLQEDRERNSRK